MKVILKSLMVLALSIAPVFGQSASTLPSSENLSTNGNPTGPADQVKSIPAAEMPNAETRFSVIRAVGGLGLVVCLIVGIYFAAKKFAPQYFTRRPSERNLKVIETLAIGDKRSISLIEVAHNRFLVGNTPHQINLLAALPEHVSLVSKPEIPPSANPEIPAATEPRTPFRSLFEVEKKHSSQYTGNPLPEDIRTKMRQLREALER